MDEIKSMAQGGWRMADYGSAAKSTSAVAGLQSPCGDHADEQKRQIAKDFESVLLNQLFDQVQQSIGRWDLEEDGTAAQVHDLFWFCLARDVADKGGLGLWKEIYQQLPTAGDAPKAADVLNEEL